MDTICARRIVTVFFLCGVFLLCTRTATAQTCMTRLQVEQDKLRCLFILNDKVYEMGSQPKGHKGHPCGMDVSSIIPSSHTQSLSGIASHLTGNDVAKICTATTPTATPMTLPTSTPRPPTLPITTPTITQVPTIFFPSATPTGRPNSTPTQNISPIPSPSSQPQSPSPTSITPQPTQALCAKMNQGDATCDDSIDLLDYVCWISIYNHSMTPGISNCVTGDFDSSGQTNSSDFMIWLTTYLSTII